MTVEPSSAIEWFTHLQLKVNYQYSSCIVGNEGFVFQGETGSAVLQK